MLSCVLCCGLAMSHSGFMPRWMIAFLAMDLQSQRSFVTWKVCDRSSNVAPVQHCARSHSWSTVLCIVSVYCKCVYNYAYEYGRPCSVDSLCLPAEAQSRGLLCVNGGVVGADGGGQQLLRGRDGRRLRVLRHTCTQRMPARRPVIIEALRMRQVPGYCCWE